MIKEQSNTKDFCLISNRIALLNYDLIIPTDFLELKTGQQINKIGKQPRKSYSSTSRVDEFTLPLTYRGIVNYDDDRWLCFEVPPEGIGGFNLFNQPRSVCIMYMISQVEDYIELIVPMVNQGEIRIYKPVFELTS
ncbi:MAG: hypothetical protein QY331_07745 [Melioribacteraceae bacterium]|nr:MAG: hypothetical protein QY331_07745 [Melioribacteraceae bacterium]